MTRPVFLLLFFLPIMGISQIVIDQWDMPVPGDTLRVSSGVNTGTYDFTLSGPNFNWDFQDLQPIVQSVGSYVSVTSTPFAYQLFFLFTSNMAVEEPEFDQLQGFQVTDTYRYFDNSGSAFEEVGLAFTINGLPLPTVYGDPDIIYTFPLQDGQSDSSTANYSFDIPGLGYYGGWKKRTNIVDGWGTLTTPYGTFDVLRIKADIQQYDSLYVDSLGIGVPFYQDITEYKWLGKGMGIPLLKVVDNGLIQTIEYRDSIRDVFTFSVPSKWIHQNIRVFPNPARGDVTIRTGFPKYELLTVELFDLTGRKLYSEKSMVRESFVLPGLQSEEMHGTHILKLKWEQGCVQKKLIFP